MSRIIVVMWLVSHVPFRVAFSGVCKWRFSYLCLFLLTAGQVLMAVPSEAWPAIAPEEMSLKDDPLKPGAPAIILHKEIFSNHHNSYHRYHYRIKIFTDEGKNYANIEIPYFADAIRVTDLRARTVRPDGKELPFQGEVFEKPVAKMGKTKFLAKTFTLPSVEVGSIVEYQYTLRSDILLTPPWPIEEELSIRRARFSLKPSVGFSGFNHKLDPSSIVEQADGTYLVELENIPALQDEVFMPPESQFKGCVATFKKQQVSDWSGRSGSVSCTHLEQLVDELNLSPNIRTARPPRLPLPDHVHCLVSLDRSPRRLKLTKPLLGFHSSFDCSMVLLQDVVQVLDRPVAATASQDSFLFHS